MQCAVVFYFVVTIFAVVYGLLDPCEFKDYWGKAALCGTHDVQHTFDFIPPIAQNITCIDMTEQPLKQLPYNGFRNLSSRSSVSKIVLADCQISYVDAGALLYLHKLSNIDLSHNDIKQIDSKLFGHTKQIKFIYLEYNKIEVLPSGLFQNLLQLEVVYLHHNQIRQVDWFVFKNTPSLRIIYLNNNQMEFMNMSFKDKFDNLTTLSLYGNPWMCDCELGPLYEFVIKFDHFNLHELVCEKPSTLQGRNWDDISRDKFVCRAEDAISVTEHDVNIPVTVYNDAKSTQDSGMTSTEPTTTTEEAVGDNIPVTDYIETTNQQVVTATPQPISNREWIIYTMFGLVLVCVIAVIFGVVFVVRHTLATTNRRRHARLPTIVKRRSDSRTRPPMRVVQNCGASENADSGLNTDEDEEEELTSIHHDEIREATIN